MKSSTKPVAAKVPVVAKTVAKGDKTALPAATSKASPLGAASAASRLGRGLGSLIRVNLPANPPVPAAGAGAQAVPSQATPAQPAPAQTARVDAATAATPVGGTVGVSGTAATAVPSAALLPVVATPVPVPTGEPLHIPVGAIKPNPHQPRREISEATIAELAESIKANGVIQPILLRKDPQAAAGGTTYTLIAGERRWRASQRAGLATIPAIVRQADEFTAAQWALVENIHREDLNPIDRGFAYQSLMGQLGLTQADLSLRLGEDRSSIANYTRLLTLAEPTKNYLRTGELSLGHAKVLAGVPDVLEQTRLAELVVGQQLSVRNLERAVQKLKEGDSTPPSPAAKPAAHYAELERRISSQIGLRVQLRAGRAKGKGKIVLHYANLDQFDQLMEKLGVSTGE
jgi:ParB family chromosome partitioning protein